MRPAVSAVSCFPTLLLVLLLFRPALQAPTTTQHNTALLCSMTIKELYQDLGSSSEEDTLDAEDKVQLCNDSLWRKNLCEFLKTVKTFSNGTEKMKKNLQSLKKYVPEPRVPTTKKAIRIRDWNDFQRKLSYYLSRIMCEQLEATQNTTVSPLNCGFVPLLSPVDWTCSN